MFGAAALFPQCGGLLFESGRPPQIGRCQTSVECDRGHVCLPRWHEDPGPVLVCRVGVCNKVSRCPSHNRICPLCGCGSTQVDRRVQVHIWKRKRGKGYMGPRREAQPVSWEGYPKKVRAALGNGLSLAASSSPAHTLKHSPLSTRLPHCLAFPLLLFLLLMNSLSLPPSLRH